MILSCDPPRHAFLVHLGTREQPRSLQMIERRVQGTILQMALNPGSNPPALVAIHFVRHGFRLPFVHGDGFAVSYFHLSSGCHQREHYFHFSYAPRGCQEWAIYPGLTVLVSEPLGSGSGGRADAAERPILHGFSVDTELLAVEVDTTEFTFEFGTDNLKDVPVTLFVKWLDVGTSEM